MMTEDIPEDLKRLEKEYNLSGGAWTTYTGTDAIIKGNEFIENALSKMEEGQKIQVNGMSNAYAIRKDGKLCIILPPICVPNPYIKIGMSEIMSRPKHICKNCNNYQVLHHDECCIVTNTYTKPTDPCNCDSFKSRLQFEREDEEAYREHMERE